MIIMMLWWILQWTSTMGLVAYDCSDKDINITSISLRGVAACPEPEPTYQTEPLQIQVVQRPELGLHHVWFCLVEVTRLITYCGMHSHSSVVAGGLANYINQVGAHECRMIHRYRVFKIGQQTIGQIVLNGTTTAAVTLQGYVDNTGRCEGTSYSEDGISWHNVIITATVKIVLMDYYALVKLTENEISLKGGVTCPFLENYCFDSTIGESTWDYKAEGLCEDKFRMLYDGPAEKVRNVITKEQYIVVNKDPNVFAVSLIKKSSILRTRILADGASKTISAGRTRRTF